MWEYKNNTDIEIHHTQSYKKGDVILDDLNKLIKYNKDKKEACNVDIHKVAYDSIEINKDTKQYLQNLNREYKILKDMEEFWYIDNIFLKNICDYPKMRQKFQELKIKGLEDIKKLKENTLSENEKQLVIIELKNIYQEIVDITDILAKKTKEELRIYKWWTHEELEENLKKWEKEENNNKEEK